MLRKVVGYTAVGLFFGGTFLLFLTSHGLLSTLLMLPYCILINVSAWQSKRAGLLGRPFDRDYLSLFHPSTKSRPDRENTVPLLTDPQ